MVAAELDSQGFDQRKRVKMTNHKSVWGLHSFPTSAPAAPAYMQGVGRTEVLPGQHKPLGAAIEALAREHVSTELKCQLLEEEQRRRPPYAVPLNAENDMRIELGPMVDEKWEDKKRVILNEVEGKRARVA